MLLRGWALREDAALKELVRVYFPVVCHYANGLLLHPAQAEDIAQEAFISLWRHAGRFDSLPALRKFLFVTARNACFNANRSRERELARNNVAAPPGANDDHLRQLMEAETLALIYQEVAHMPARMREIFYLSFEEGLSLQEIAGKMQIQVQTVKNQKYKAFELLRKKLGNNRPVMLMLLRVFRPF